MFKFQSSLDVVSFSLNYYGRGSQTDNIKVPVLRRVKSMAIVGLQLDTYTLLLHRMCCAVHLQRSLYGKMEAYTQGLKGN